MKTNLLLTLALLSSVGGAVSAFGEESPQKAEQLDTQVRVQMGYLLYLPKDYDKQDKWPLLMFLHGSGERGSNLEKVKVHGPPKLIAEGKSFPFIVVSPQCPDEKGWEPIELLALLDDLQKKLKVDPDRIYVTGLSMGGAGSWRLAAYAPDRLAAIAPICGSGELYWAKKIAHLPIWSFHGGRDSLESIQKAYAMIDALRQNKANPKFTVYPEAAHDSWTETYNNPQFYEWLLAQKRADKK